MTTDRILYHPICYAICITPDLDAFTFSANAVITLKSSEPTDRISLQILELSVTGCRCTVAGNEKNCGFATDTETETLNIDLPEKMTGEIVVSIDYAGTINDRMAGFYRSRYTHRGKTHLIAVTQFQESDARRAFPCMDHPRFKARFDLTLEIPDHLTAIANTTVKQEIPVENGKKRVVFNTTPIMSTYLVFFGVGPFSIIIDDKDPRVRAAVLPGMEKSIAYGLEFTRKALAFCETYYGIAYPLPKLDVIAVPDFAFGAMENWGAITFRENLLLYDPDMTSVDGEERICEVIAHEMAHQWFGNLVTPVDWKYIWLNESFATYFGYGVVAHYHPDWQVWEEFLETQTATAMARDGLTDTTSIEIPGGSHVVINSSTAPIIYSKGGSILRQIEGYLGGEAFAKGLHHYLETHAYDCTQSSDLWAALEESSGKPVTAIMEGWVFTPGHPLISVHREENRLILGQRRFSYLPEDLSTRAWPIPLIVGLYDQNGTVTRLTRMFDTDTMAIDIDPATHVYTINDGQTGFFRVSYDDAENLERLGGRVRDNTLSAVDRWGIENDLFALVMAGRALLPDYLRFISHYESESDPMPLSAILAHLMELGLIVGKKEASDVSARLVQFLTAALSRTGHFPEKDEPHGFSRLRNSLFWPAALFGMTDTVAVARDAVERLKAGQGVHPDIRRGIMQAAACAGDDTVFEWLRERISGSDSEHDRINVLRAMGCFTSPERIQRVLAYILNEVPDRNKFIPVAQLARNPYAVDLMWDWYVANIDRLASIHPIIHERIIAAIVPICGLSAADDVAAHFENRLLKPDAAAAVIRMSLERLEINRRLRRNTAIGDL